MTFEIEDGIAIPKPNKPGRPSKYPFSAMELGQSFYIEGITQAGARSAAYCWSRNHNGTKFVTRAEGEGIRIWRTE